MRMGNIKCKNNAIFFPSISLQWGGFLLKQHECMHVGFFYVHAKGQLISECLFGVLNFPKTNEKFDKFLPKKLKSGQINKLKAFSYNSRLAAGQPRPTVTTEGVFFFHPNWSATVPKFWDIQEGLSFSPQLVCDRTKILGLGPFFFTFCGQPRIN